MTTTISDRKQGIGHYIAGALFLIWSCWYLPTCSGLDYSHINRSKRSAASNISNAEPEGTRINQIQASYADTPKVKYIYVLKIPSDSLVESLNNMRVLMNDFGVEMGGSRIKEYQQFFQQQINRIIQHAVQDSVKIK